MGGLLGPLDVFGFLLWCLVSVLGPALTHDRRDGNIAKETGFSDAYGSRRTCSKGSSRSGLLQVDIRGYAGDPQGEFGDTSCSEKTRD